MDTKHISVYTEEVSSPSSRSGTEKTMPTPLNRKSSAFFPWLDTDSEKRKFSIGKLKRFPILGAIGLLGSLCTIILSFLILHFFNGRPTDQWNFKLLPKPAALLSIVLSVNTLMIHLAISQGMAVSWWYRASQKKATVEDMHNTWAAGSLIEALLAWKAFNYVALATVFAATLPANGILLQNAISSISAVTYEKNAPINFNMASSIPKDWKSATLNYDGTVGVYNNIFADIIPSIIANDPLASVDTYSNLTTCKGTCHANLTGLGFESKCLRYQLPYNLPTTEEMSNGDAAVENYLVMSVDVLWDALKPNQIGVNILEKPESNCTGDFWVNNCTLTLGQATYATEVVFNASTDFNGNPIYSWSHNSNGSFSPVSQDFGKTFSFTPFESVPDVNQTIPGDIFSIQSSKYYTAFGGIAAALQSYYNSSVIIRPLFDDHGNDYSSIEMNGQFSRQSAAYDVGFYSDGFSLAEPACNISWTYDEDSSYYSSVAEEVLSGIHSTFFFMSIMMADIKYDDGVSQVVNETFNWNTLQHIPNAHQFITTVIYRVVWKWWAASLAVTLAVILFVLPTFWGFWTLARRTTLSPFETARAFHAPVIEDAPPNLDTKELLRTVGNKNLHTDLVHSPITSPPIAHNGYQAPTGYFPVGSPNSPQQYSPQQQFPPVQQISTQQPSSPQQQFSPYTDTPPQQLPPRS